jgi:hypothetical protein
VCYENLLDLKITQPLKRLLMERKPMLKAIFILPFFLLSSFVFAFTTGGPDTCTINDDCQQAILISNIISDSSFVCVDGCNMYASPDTLIQSCQMGDFPTVWYRLDIDPAARVMNVEVTSSEFEAPVISLFKGGNGCSNLEQVYFSEESLACIIGTDGLAKATGVQVDASDTYFLAISSLFSIGGHFQLCVSTLSTGFVCVVDRGIAITARSNGGPLEGPFDPGETVSICMNVNSYTAAGNGCQWFQGLVPVFGNGWDPVSFDSTGQPTVTSINGYGPETIENGLYGASTWDWFTDVDYHYDNTSLTVDDIDQNGTLDICNSVYETDCPQMGVTGACCGPCWGETIGDLLPGGWFAYGVNGSCPTPGPPVAVDWGDGNTCGAGMGPWSFCFDLVTRGNPDCNMDSTRKDLSVGFFTFADGEVGAWTGDASVCAYDGPAKISLKAKCGRISTSDTEILEPLCSGDTLQYPMDVEGVTHWEWNISPHWAAPSLTNTSENGSVIVSPLVNTGDEPVDVTGMLIGRQAGSEDIVIKQFTFKLNDAETCGTVSVDPSSESSSVGKIRLYPMPVDQSVVLEWAFALDRPATIDIYNSQGVLQGNLPVLVGEGNQKRIPTGTWAPGIYVITLSNADFSYVARLVKL